MQQCAYYLVYGDHPLPYEIKHGRNDADVWRVVGQAAVEAAYLAAYLGVDGESVKPRLLALQNGTACPQSLVENFARHRRRAEQTQLAPPSAKRLPNSDFRARTQRRRGAALRRLQEHIRVCSLATTHLRVAEEVEHVADDSLIGSGAHIANTLLQNTPTLTTGEANAHIANASPPEPWKDEDHMGTDTSPDYSVWDEPNITPAPSDGEDEGLTWPVAPNISPG